MNDKINKIKKEIKNTINELEKDYSMSYEDMYNCYNKTDEPIDYHIGVSFVEGMERALRLMENENQSYEMVNVKRDIGHFLNFYLGGYIGLEEMDDWARDLIKKWDLDNDIFKVREDK